MVVSCEEGSEIESVEENVISSGQAHEEVKRENITVEEAISDVVLGENVTLNVTNSGNSSSSSRVVTCLAGAGGEPVHLVNGSELVRVLTPDANVTTSEAAGRCVLVLFYARYCTFSAMAAPHFNALSRAFPHVKLVAIDAMKYMIFNTQNGIVGVPTLILFHNGRPISKFNDTEYTLELFSRYLTRWTGLKPEHKSYVTSADFAGPVSSTPDKDTDYFLVISWLFILICAVYYFTKSTWWRCIVEVIQNTWREAEAQHEHTD